jgi:hypothetical protein
MFFWAKTSQYKAEVGEGSGHPQPPGVVSPWSKPTTLSHCFNYLKSQLRSYYPRHQDSNPLWVITPDLSALNGSNWTTMKRLHRSHRFRIESEPCRSPSVGALIKCPLWSVSSLFIADKALQQSAFNRVDILVHLHCPIRLFLLYIFPSS